MLNQLKELVPVSMQDINGKNLPTISARQLHSFLGAKRDFTNWIKARIKQYEFSADIDYFLVESLSSPKLVSAKSRQQVIHDYILTLNMAKELAMVERNDKGRVIRRYFIQCEEALQNVAPETLAAIQKRVKARLEAANYFKPMCAALALKRTEQGKATEPHHYQAESNLLSKLVLGLTPKQWNNAQGFTGDARDNMNVPQLEHLSYLERTNITLIELGFNYQERKEKLGQLSLNWLTQRVAKEGAI